MTFCVLILATLQFSPVQTRSKQGLQRLCNLFVHGHRAVKCLSQNGNSGLSASKVYFPFFFELGLVI
jgi:hypothetical protein